MISKETFISYMEYCKELNRRDDAFNEAIKLISQDGYAFIYGEIISKISELLLHGLGVKDESDWMGYYMWELDFGAKYNPGMITHNHVDYPLQTPEQLYNLLMETK